MQNRIFVAVLSGTLKKEGLSSLAREPAIHISQPTPQDLCAQLTALKARSGLPKLLPAWQMASALEALLNQLCGRPANFTPSTALTISNALDLMGALCVRGLQSDLVTNPPVRLLAVDDDAICRHAISFALKKALDGPDLASDGPTALSLASQQRYEAIFLDLEMPGMDGFELCAKIRQTPGNRNTPVIFVTRHSDFESRAKSNRTGGQDLIGKPFLTFEVAVKALTLILRGRLPNAKNAPELMAVA